MVDVQHCCLFCHHNRLWYSCGFTASAQDVAESTVIILIDDIKFFFVTSNSSATCTSFSQLLDGDSSNTVICVSFAIT